MYRVANAPIRSFPFPHLYVEDVFPADFYAELQRHRLVDESYRRLSETGRVTKGAYEARLCLFPVDVDRAPMADRDREFWRGLFKMFDDREFTQLWLDLFGPTIRQHFADDLPDVAQRGGTKISAEAMLMRDLPTYALGPHTDSPAKVVSVLIYLPTDDRRPELGTALYLPKDRRFTCPGGPHHSYEPFERVVTMPYRPNALVAFPKTSRTFHGVEPVLDETVRRDLLLYDLRIDLG